MKMQTVRKILMPQETSGDLPRAVSPTLLPPLTSFGPLLSAPLPQTRAKPQQLAEKRAGEAYLATRASFEFRSRLAQ